MFQIRKGKINMIFKTLPLEKITKVCLGGAIGNIYLCNIYCIFLKKN